MSRVYTPGNERTLRAACATCKRTDAALCGSAAAAGFISADSSAATGDFRWAPSGESGTGATAGLFPAVARNRTAPRAKGVIPRGGGDATHGTFAGGVLAGRARRPRGRSVLCTGVAAAMGDSAKGSERAARARVGNRRRL